MTRTLATLAFAGLRSRLLASVLTIALAAAAAATIALALLVGASASDVWERTFAAANGAHVVVLGRTPDDVRTIAGLPGVAEHNEPGPTVFTTSEQHDGPIEVRLAGLDGKPRVDAPVLTDGTVLREGGIVLEESFARALGVSVGSQFEVAGARGPIPLEVVGTAIQPSQGRYPLSQPGVGWVTRSAIAEVEPDRARWTWTEAVRLADPDGAAAFAEQAAAGFPPGEVDVQIWQERRDEALADSRTTVVVLTTFSMLLLIVVFAVIAILVGARAGDQHREIGILKAAGLTPLQVSSVFAIESAALGLAGVAVGIPLGVLLAPRIAEISARTLLSSPAAISAWEVVVAASAVLVVVVASTLAAARRSTRFTVLQAIRAGVAASRPHSRVGDAIARSSLPLALRVGLKDQLTRRARALLLVAVIALTGAVVVAALAMEATVEREAAASPVPGDDDAALRMIVYVLDGVLLLLTATALLAVTLLGVRERVRDYGILKALGLTPGQLTSALVGGQAALAVVAALLSVPLGLGLFFAVYRITNGGADNAVVGPWWRLALVPIGTVALATAITSLPARRASRVRPADALRYD
jgi:putative ABC transport system permease protein